MEAKEARVDREVREDREVTHVLMVEDKGEEREKIIEN